MEREPTIQTVSQLSSHSGTETGGRREINEQKKKVFLRRKSRSCWIKWFKDRINIKKKQKKKASVMSTPQGCTTLFFFSFILKMKTNGVRSGSVVQSVQNTSIGINS